MDTKQFIKWRLEGTTARLKASLDHSIEESNHLLERLENNGYLGLGGSLQNNWKIFWLLGLISAYNEILENLEKTENNNAE